MRDKRKEILREILGEFAADEEATPREEKRERPAESEFKVEKVLEKPSPKPAPRGPDIKDVEIIEGDLIPKYKVSLPKFSEKERELLNEIREKLVEVAVSKGEDFRIDESTFMSEVKEFLKMKGVRNVDKLAKQISQEMLGYGELDPLIKDDDLEEIMVIGVNKPVFVYHRKMGMMITNVVFKDDDDIKAIIDLIARQVNRRIDQQTPILDARLPDGSRINATIPPVSPDGSTLTIRKFRKDPFTVVDLINFKTMSSHLAAFLWVCTDGLGVKPCNAIVAGGTGSGKTTTLNTISAFVPPTERIITIEDTLELQLPHTHVLRMETRPPNIEGKGELDMDTLVKNSLRQRPDRVIVGEVRGGEAITLFTALNTGHSGFGTLHANTARETITRLINPPMNVPRIMIPALDFIIMQNRMYRPEGGSIRRITEVAEVVGMEEGNVQLNRVFEWNSVTDKVEYVGIASQTLREIAELRAISINEIEEEIERRRLVLEYLADENVRSIDEVGHYINEYYRDPDGVLDSIL
ncbi:Flp pilus assembly complex ATPase component TadA [Methanothermobacter marburgensis]|uniref:Predicted ATPase n=1 Tax=Methanothermobacter marburgensis (strain ATCC BAA-927 / DSM 2133 / JCM 14651 / NBRC 100331 / OCM 82 / Marburg) TaxID=79929 RepID=D9PUJ1_METTM|nr:ATPase, T2SS/T4P/T4SS family [Methanothermobacter marburgensis]ADL57889.1 predicted ATPase [Methanothermobacter marburgensis str. Marburg]WBF10092.1 Flp pilus assembly complex ATPase component TadA [Methanothermobacter marburgensis]